MSFLAPLFLVGALAVALPVLFHLIRRTSREKTVFSSLMFLMPTPPRVTRRSRLENIFLLILRCLVLCLLALGFARPFVQKPIKADPASGAARRVVILLDSSASMRRSGLWADARAKAGDILKQAAPIDQVALFTFDRQVSRVVDFEQWNAMAANDRAPSALKRLADLNPGWSATHLGNALVTAAEALEEKHGESQKFALRQIVLISDLQEGSRLDTLQAYEWPKGIELRIEPVKNKRPTNAGLQLVTDTAEAAKTDTEAGPRVRVSNSSDSKREQFQLGWARAAQPGFVGAPVDVYVPPGQSRILEAPKTPAGLADGRLVLAGDDEDFDNTVYLAPRHPEKIHLFFLGQDGEKDSAQCLYYLKRAFQQTSQQSIEIHSWPPETAAPPASFEASPLIISTDALPGAQLDALAQALKAGKTALLVLKDARVSAKTLSQLAGVDNLPVGEAAGGDYAMLGQIDFEHPLFASFATPRFSDFTKIHFWKHRRVDLAKVKGAKVLARFDNGDPALAQIPAGQGTLLLLTSGWQPSDSQLALSSKFVPLLYSMLEQSGGIKDQLSQYSVGDPVPLPGAESASTTNQLAHIRKPDGTQVEVAASTRFSQTDLPGIYTVAGTTPLQFAVNLDASESKTAPLPLEELERLGVPLGVGPAHNAPQLEQKRLRLQATELEQRQKLWKWLILAALMVIVMETLLAGWLTRRPMPIS